MTTPLISQQVNALYEFGIPLIESPLDLKKVREGTLWMTRCSKRKSRLTEGVPREIYTSPQNQEFYKWAEKSGIPYGTISDLYGLVMNDQVIKTYDLAPPKERVILRVLGEVIGAKCKSLGYKSIIFYCEDYAEAKPYLSMLSFSGLEAHWVQFLLARSLPK